jgi:SNF2 family DNA or RNA helicase
VSTQRRKYIPRKFAPMVSSFMADTPRCAVWGKPGTGKTIFTLTHLEMCYRVCGETEPTLVIAPLRVARDGWAKEAAKWEHLQGFDVVPVVGTAAERKAAMRRDAPVYVTNYENLPWLVDALDGRWPFRRVVPDEAHRLKGFRVKQGGQRAAALARFAHSHVKEWINLTGTPASNGLRDLWAQTWYLDAGQRLGRTFSAFEERWFGYKRVKDAISGKPGIVPVIFPFAQEQIQERLKDICLTLDPRDWFDLQEPIVNIIEVELPASARAKYRDLERELFFRLGEFDVEVFNAAALSNKCLQMANGAAYVDPEKYGDGKWVVVHDEKLDALQELIDETGDDPLLVAYQFKSDLARILARWPDALQLAKAGDLAQAQAGKGKLWLGHPDSVGEGIDGLQEWCNTVVFFGQTWKSDKHEQIIERVGPMRQLQAGKDRAVFVHYIVTRNTVDEAVMARRDGKRSVEQALMEYMKREC